MRRKFDELFRYYGEADRERVVRWKRFDTVKTSSGSSPRTLLLKSTVTIGRRVKREGLEEGEATFNRFAVEYRDLDRALPDSWDVDPDEWRLSHV